MRRWLSIVVLTGCWSSGQKDLERKVSQLSAELAASRAQNEILQRRMKDMRTDRDDAIEAERRLEERLRELTAANGRLGGTLPKSPPPPLRPDPAKTYAVPIGTSHAEGPADAKVTMIVAGEYGCPFCERMRTTLVDLRAKYPKDLRIVHKQFVVHPTIATVPALAICAADKQKKHDALDPLLWDKGFKTRTYDVPAQLPDGTTQPCWNAPEGCPIVVGFAKDAGLDVPRFKSDMVACEAEVNAVHAELVAFHVNATPSFFINGRYTSGAQPIESFSQLIDEELAKADERIKAGTKRARYYKEWVIDRGEK